MLGLPGNGKWEIPQFIKAYDNLINSLKNAGYEVGVNLFVYGYDWRKTVADAAVDLRNFVDGLGLTEKIDFIGHSYGGLVIRGYAQVSGTDNINEIIDVASPNLGTVNAYGAWEGGVFWDRPWWQKGALEILIETNKLTGLHPLETNIDTIRRVAPSIRDTLPAFDYLERDGVSIPETSMLQRNIYLPWLNTSAGEIDSLVRVIGGTGNETRRTIKTTSRDASDAILGRWEDGRPIEGTPFIFSNDGDDTVLNFSAIGSFSSTSMIGQSHGGVVSSVEGIGKIFDELGLDKAKIVASVVPDTRERVLVAMLRSPGQLSICNPSNICNGDLGIYLPEYKLFMLPGFGDDNLSIEVEANGQTGQYNLVTGKIDDQGSNWREMPGNLVDPDETDSYSLEGLFDTTAPTIIPHFSPEPNSNGWNNTDVTVTWEINDPESAVVSSTNCEGTIIDTETSELLITCTATSNGGTTSRMVTVRLDKTKPEILIASPLSGTNYTVNSEVASDWNVSDELSGLDGTESGTQPSGSTINTDVLGDFEFNVSATDLAGNTNFSVSTYDVVKYEFSGLLGPLSFKKSIKKTSSVPVKFQLRNTFGEYVTSADARLNVNGLPAVSSGFANIGNIFNYNFLTNQYVFNLSTKMLLIGTNKLLIDLDDGSSYEATMTIK